MKHTWTFRNLAFTNPAILARKLFFKERSGRYEFLYSKLFLPGDILSDLRRVSLYYCPESDASWLQELVSACIGTNGVVGVPWSRPLWDLYDWAWCAERFSRIPCSIHLRPACQCRFCDIPVPVHKMRVSLVSSLSCVGFLKMDKLNSVAQVFEYLKNWPRNPDPYVRGVWFESRKSEVDVPREFGDQID